MNKAKLLDSLLESEINSLSESYIDAIERKDFSKASELRSQISEMFMHKSQIADTFTWLNHIARRKAEKNGF